MNPFQKILRANLPPKSSVDRISVRGNRQGQISSQVYAPADDITPSPEIALDSGNGGFGGGGAGDAGNSDPTLDHPAHVPIVGSRFPNMAISKGFAPTGLSLLAPLVGTVPVASSATNPGVRSFPVNARGFIIQQLTLGGTNPNTFTLGVNKSNATVTMVVRDAFHAEDLLITSIELYNTSQTVELAVIGVAFRGSYTPSANSISTISGIGNGLFSPLATSVASLAAIATIGLTPGVIVEYVDSTTLALVTWQLTLNASSPVTGAGITVPNDYNAVTNPYVWIEV